MNSAEYRILIAGSGGQGILFFGRVLSYSCMTEGKEVTWFPSYGAEMRGGTANCTVIVSREMIGSPIVRNPDILIVFNEPSHSRFLTSVRPGGLLLYDISLFSLPESRSDIDVCGVPALSIAASCNAPAVANMVMLGALLALRTVTRLESALQALKLGMNENNTQLFQLNQIAVRKGYEAFNDTKSAHCRR